MTARVPVAAILRVSTDVQAGADRGGLPRQREAVAAAVERHGLDVVFSAELEGVSGNRVSETPAWQEVRRLLAAGLIRGVVCDAVDRLCRASDLDLTVLADLQRAGASIYTPGEVRGLAGADDGLVAGILALLAGREKREIVRRAVAGKEALRRRGRWVADPSKLPAGVAFDPRTGGWSYTPEVAEVVELARRYADEPISLRRLASDSGVAINTLRRRLSHPLYRGRLVYDTREETDASGRRREVPRAPGEVISVPVLDPPAFPPELAARVDRKLAEQARSYDGRVRRRDGVDRFLLRAIGFCSRCGERLDTVTRPRDGVPTFLYRCASARRKHRAEPCDAGEIPIADAHAVVARSLRAALADPVAVVDAWHRLRSKEAGGRAAEAERARAELSRLTTRRERLVDAMLDGAITRAEHDRRRGLLDRQVEAAAARVEAAAAADAGREGAEAALVELVRRIGDRSVEPIELLRQAGGRAFLDRPPGRSAPKVAVTRIEVDAVAVLSRGSQTIRASPPADQLGCVVLPLAR
ncbi:MAG: recombinase family protein [Rhodocyclaceae bacterium]|nr:MAG: recombinase family protein [Rhodocyclaceae bacterium]